MMYIFLYYVLPAILRFVRVRAKFAVNFSASTSLLEFLQQWIGI